MVPDRFRLRSTGRWCVLLLLVLCAPAGSAQGDPDEVADDGRGLGYWGLVGEPSDSTTATYTGNSMPLWEALLVWPFRVITFPIKLLVDGIGLGVTWADQSGTLGRLLEELQVSGFPLDPIITAGGLEGFGGGLSLELDPFLGNPDQRFKANAATTFNGHTLLSAGYQIGRRHTLEFGAGSRFIPNAQYYGLGPTSSVLDESRYTSHQRWLAVHGSPLLSEHWRVAGEVIYSRFDMRDPWAKFDPSVSEIFAGDPPPGFGETSQGFTFALSATHEDAGAIGTSRPRSGGRRKVKIGFFDGVDDDPGQFVTYRVEATQYFELPWYSRRVLALRGVATWLDRTADAGVPVDRRFTNDGVDSFRGYRSFRWRDRGLALLTAEYRWPLWAERDADGLGADAYLFADAGQVFGDRHEIALERLTLSSGFGFRVVQPPAFFGALEFAFSNEETVITFSGGRIFEISDNRLYDGRNPIPVR